MVGIASGELMAPDWLSSSFSVCVGSIFDCCELSRISGSNARRLELFPSAQGLPRRVGTESTLNLFSQSIVIRFHFELYKEFERKL